MSQHSFVTIAVILMIESGKPAPRRSHPAFSFRFAFLGYQHPPYVRRAEGATPPPHPRGALRAPTPPHPRALRALRALRAHLCSAARVYQERFPSARFLSSVAKLVFCSVGLGRALLGRGVGHSHSRRGQMHAYRSVYARCRSSSCVHSHPQSVAQASYEQR